MHNFPLDLLKEILIFYIFHIAIVVIIHNLVLMERMTVKGAGCGPGRRDGGQ